MERAGMKWRKSSHSGNGGANCVEVAAAAGQTHVRDTKDRQGGMLIIDAAAWVTFVKRIKDGATDPR